MGMSVFLTGLLLFLLAIVFVLIVGVFAGKGSSSLPYLVLFTWAISFFGGLFATVIGLLMIIWGV